MCACRVFIDIFAFLIFVISPLFELDGVLYTQHFFFTQFKKKGVQREQKKSAVVRFKHLSQWAVNVSIALFTYLVLLIFLCLFFFLLATNICVKISIDDFFYLINLDIITSVIIYFWEWVNLVRHCCLPIATNSFLLINPLICTYIFCFWLICSSSRI